MSKPILIWTFRRTGGTTLATLLTELSEHPTVDQEPFNWDRCFGSIAKDWYDYKRPDHLQAGLSQVLADHPVIKHCYELHADSFNAALFHAARTAGYRQMILDRRDEVGRILSLELAKLSGAWGKMGAAERYHQIATGEVVLEPIDLKAALAQIELCHSRRVALRALIQNSGEPVREVCFEDIYSDMKRGRALIHEILQDFELDRTGDVALEQQIRNALKHHGQNSGRMLSYVPNLAEARQCFEAAVAALQSDVIAL